MVMLSGDIGYTNCKGKVFASRDILYTVIALATKEVKGVAALMTSRNTVAKKPNESVKVNFLESGLEVSVSIKVLYNVCAADLSSKVQESIKNGLSSMLDAKIKKIDVNIMGVEFMHNGIPAMA